MLWQFFFLRGIENGIEYRYFSRYRIEVRNSSIVTTLVESHESDQSTRKTEGSLTPRALANWSCLSDHASVVSQR